MAVNEAEWDQNQRRRGAHFLQSLEWAKFQQSQGSSYRLVEARGWSCLLLKRQNRFGEYLFAPYGPTIDSPAQLDDCLSRLRQIAKEVSAGWLKIEPMIGGSSLNPIHELRACGAVRAVRDVEPSLTRILDLSPPVDEILAGVSQSTRSFIRKNQRENFLTFKTSTAPSDMPAFAGLLDTVASRKGVSFFSADYFTKQAEVLMPAKMMFLELAYSGQQLVGGAVMHDFGPAGSYTYAASLPEASKLSVSALLLWQAIVNAKARGIKQLDLYGTAPEDAPASHPWYGFSSYKKKFGGQIIEHAGTWDIPMAKKYKVYRTAQSLNRRFKRL